MKITTLKNRIYADYLMAPRLDEYRRLLETALEAGYQHLSLRDYFAKKQAGTLKGKYFLHRHDIDTDLKTTRKMFEIEQGLDIHATYYFRQSTIDIGLMREIEAFGSEASYHFEELAQYCKDHHIKKPQKALEALPQIRKVFISNFLGLEKQLDYKIKTVSSHGDFVNRKLKIPNQVITEDKALRRKLGIEMESYDEELMSGLDIYISDKPHPHYYSPLSPFEALQKHDVICLLSHPRHWHTNWPVNSKDNILRVWEGARW